jgi:hypothetical protein
VTEVSYASQAAARAARSPCYWCEQPRTADYPIATGAGQPIGAVLWFCACPGGGRRFDLSKVPS